MSVLMRLTTLMKLYGRHTSLVHTFDTSVSQMLKGLFTNYDKWLVCSYYLIVTGATCVAGNAQLIISRTPHFIPFRVVNDFTHSLYIHYIICQWWWWWWWWRRRRRRRRRRQQQQLLNPYQMLRQSDYWL